MKRILFCLALAAVLPLPHAFASNVDVNVGINVGARPVVVVPRPAYHQPPVVIEEPPLFIEPPELGFHVAVGIPQNIFFVGNTYYLFNGNVWYASSHYGGPWVVTRYNALPLKLRRHSFERIRYYRDAGYRHYREGRDSYWKQHQFRPNKEWKNAEKADRRQMKQDWKDERKWEKEQRKQEERGSRGGHRGE